MLAILEIVFNAVGPLVSSVMGYFTAKSNNAVATNGQNVTGDVSVAQAQIAAQIEVQKLAASERVQLAQSRWTVWMLPELFAVFSAHVISIVIDSMFHLNWQIARLPPPFDDLEYKVLLTGAGVAAGLAAYQRIFGR